MKQTLLTKGLFCLSSVVMMALPLQGQAEVKRGGLISIGQASQSSSELVNSLKTLGYTAVTMDDEKHDSAWSFGYRQPFRKHWSVDIQYLQQGKTAPTIHADMPAGKDHAQAAQDAVEAMSERGQGVSVVALYHRPVGSYQLALQGGFGVFAWQSERTAIVGTAEYTDKSRGVSPLLQLGMNYPLSKRVQLELAWQHTFMPDKDVDRVGLGIVVSF